MHFRGDSFRVKLSSLALIALWACLASPVADWAKDKEKDKGNQPPAADVDSGSFGVYSAGHRVATETFSIKSRPDGSVVSSEFKSEQGEQKAAQSSELHLTPSVELQRYSWKETLPEPTEAVVEPSESFLVEHFGPPGETPKDQSFLLPASTTILDDYSFIQREVLAWKYLATSCRKDKGVLGCPLSQKVQFGTLNPHARSSMGVSVEFTGQEKLTLHSGECQCNRFVLGSENGDWTFWLDEKFKLVRLLSDTGTEVLRD
jgi:hypothetical protein